MVRDKRRIDPVTGTLRPGVADVGGAATPPVAEASPDPAAADARVGELVGDLQRLKAEFDNYRRRVERDRAVSAELASATVLTALLPVLDDIDRARSHGDLTGAFAAVGEALVAAVTRLGLERFGEAQTAFDPTIHDALLHTESEEVTEATVTDVLRPGYRYAQRVLRPVQVAVAAPARAPAGDGEAAQSPEPGSDPTRSDAAGPAATGTAEPDPPASPPVGDDTGPTPG